ncbi:hypothetical protein IE53DRAFT_387764 [Violaceomyces palustris]|uniref:Uncharacterized protein n=1 Tax=Violaceomyces palustris TaxID=1673888 RepID=A0ACD0NVX8_9BASI|nr:hypothetical protein IE53DRAFT_387764 [Violaceomyces palustris]
MRISGCITAALLALAGSFASATSSSSSRPHLSALRHHKRDASTLMSGGKNNEGENHSPLKVPAGAKLRSLPVGDQGEEIAVYWTRKPKNRKATQAYVMIHGKLRNGNTYWSTMNKVLQSAVKDGYPNADENAVVTAPQFFSTIYNSGQYNSSQLAWADVNAWQAGETATHPKRTSVTAFDALDALIDHFANKTKYPALERLNFVGHGGGGQLLNRYAIVGKDAPSGLAVRWIAGDPSSAPYFTKDRPLADASVANISSCPLYNTWRYGFDNFTGTLQGLKTPKEYFAQTIKRDVRYIVGYQDTSANGDQYCMALLQGGVARRDRNLSWWRYINTLARTAEDLTGFPGSFSNLPDWSDVSLNVINHKLVVVEDADHDAVKVFGSTEGRAVLFDDGDLPTGWRPKGWRASGNGQKIAAAGGGNATSITSTSSSPVSSVSQAQSSIQASGASALITCRSIFALLALLAPTIALTV